MNNLKLAALGALATAGLATTAIAQPKVEHRPSAKENSQGQERGAMQGDMPGMMAMMNDPEMRAQMMDMMRNCKEMMKKKQDQMSSAEAG